jgi:NAD(P)-dependent dehydrogenase (short-subunit alcohol dehydrogenase family)
LVISLDVADAAAMEAAAEQVERELGPIDAWVNNAMATVYAPVDATTPEEYRRVTEVTYLGTVYGTLAALKRMRARGRGAIVQVGSALSYRAIPLQSAYCAAKYAIRGFTDALRVELIHDRLPITLTMVQLPGINTPQFDWALNRMPHRARPLPPVYQPEVAAEAIVFAARSNRREIFVGLPTWQAILGNKLAPWWMDRILARKCYAEQFRSELAGAEAAGNLFAPTAGHQEAHGSFGTEARAESWDFWLSRYRNVLGLGLAALVGWRLSRPVRRSRVPARR